MSSTIRQQRRAGLGPAGWWGLEGAVEGWAPDLFTFGKVIGAGLPVAAVGGRAEVMNLLAPLGPVYQAGTLSGNPVATAAGLAQLRLADDDAYARLGNVADEVARLVGEALSVAGVPHVVQRAGTLFSVAFGTTTPVTDYAQLQATQSWRYGPFFHALLDGGIYPPPSAFEAWFVSSAHDDAALDRLVEALPAAASAAAAARPV